MSDDTISIHFNYNLLDCMDSTVYSSLDLSVKLETLNFEQRCQHKLKSVYPSILATKINHEQKQDVPAGL